jgi:hypothetical protein
MKKIVLIMCFSGSIQMKEMILILYFFNGLEIFLIELSSIFPGL